MHALPHSSLEELAMPTSNNTPGGIERFIPAKGTADEVAKAICSDPAFVAAIQRGIDRHDSGDAKTMDKTSGLDFRQAIARELTGTPGLERNVD
jgi:hypothetical protein